jgi:integrase
MRHTAASLLADYGLSLEEIALVLGHKSIRMLEQHYRHVLRTERSAHVDAMEAMLGEPRRTRKRTA